jgi:hypothetical protein
VEEYIDGGAEGETHLIPSCGLVADESTWSRHYNR